MEKINRDDIKKVSLYAGDKYDKSNKSDKRKFEELKRIYDKLEYIGKLLSEKGYEYIIRKNPLKQSGPGKFEFRPYLWLRVFPKGMKNDCKDKLAYIIGISKGSLQFHLSGLKEFDEDPKTKTKHPVTKEVSTKTWTELDIEKLSYDDIVAHFIKFDKENRKLFIKTGALFGAKKCIELMKKFTYEDYIKLLKQKKQIILQGPPGTGKTYLAPEIAMWIINENKSYSSREDLMKDYHSAMEEGQIVFTTFHQSMDYEEFIEGIKPQTADGEITYEVENGIFKELCLKAEEKGTLSKLEEAIEKFKEKLSEEGEIELKTKKGHKFTVTYRGGKTFRIRPERSKTDENRDFPANIQYIKKIYKDEKLPVYNKSYVWGILNHLQKEYNIPPFKETTQQKNYVLIIDEINRGNISKIFGELITLLENDKRLGEENEITVTLPYSGEKFGVPSNLYIIGTMNTADRSLGHLDYAIRRRFAFISLKAEKEKISAFYTENDLPDALKTSAEKLFDETKKIIEENILPDFDAGDLMIGHSYFMAKNEEELRMKLEYEIKPLLYEYLKDGILMGGKEDIDKLSV